MALLPVIGRKEKGSSGDTAPASAQGAAGTPAKARKRRRHKRPSISTIIALLLVFSGAGLIAYPTFADWWNSYHQSRAISSYVSAVEETDHATIEAMLAEAHAYNQRLLNKSNRFMMTDDERAEYSSILDLTGSGVMGYIQINNIGVNLPIYHGVDESVLQVAIGHIEGSSLPVGGATTHAVVSGHRGLPSARLFTDLDKLVEGDTFTITVLDQTITYMVDQIRIVEPEDMSDLALYQGEDFVTLVTCTPYGVNTHRLLVRGHRIENLANALAIPAEAVQIPNYIAVPAVAIPMLFVYLVGTLLYYRFRRPAFNKEKVLRELEELQQEQVAAGSEPQPAPAAEPQPAPEAEPQPDPEPQPAPEDLPEEVADD